MVRTREEGMEVTNAGFARREIDKYEKWTKKGRKKRKGERSNCQRFLSSSSFSLPLAAACQSSVRSGPFPSGLGISLSRRSTIDNPLLDHSLCQNKDQLSFLAHSIVNLSHPQQESLKREQDQPCPHPSTSPQPSSALCAPAWSAPSSNYTAYVQLASTLFHTH
jgi:hypothetical protein